MSLRVWRLDPARAAEWRDIRLQSLRLAPEAFDSRLAEQQDRPLADFAARLDAVATFAAGDTPGQPLAVACWQGGLDQDAPLRAWLLSVFVTPAARGRGYGEAVIAATLRDARASGQTSCGLHVLADNAPAIALYRRIGFRATGQQGVTNRHGLPERRMVLDPLPA